MKTHIILKKALSFALAVMLFMTAITVFAEGEAENGAETLAKPSFITTEGGLYANAQTGSASTQAWQKWESYSGLNASSSAMYFFLPAVADNGKVDIYNNFSGDVTIGTVTVKSGETAQISYTDGANISVSQGKNRYTLIIRKSDAEASVYVNDTNTSFVDADGNTVNADLYSFLIRNKQNSVKGSSVAIAGKSGITETTLKKIKGRGNTNWTETDKKPFNLTFNDTVTIGHTTNKKFSFVSNAKDSTLIRNSVMYDMAHDVGLPYSPNASFVDFYVNGVYRGCYIACDKVDLGKSSLVSLKDTSDTVNSGFNFLIEVDVWNYRNDVYFETSRGYHVVLKTPELEDYDSSNADMKAKYDYIKNTYQNFENVLYNGTLSELEQICDLDSLALMYLLQDLGKNCDGGYTSTYFTYNADEGKFYAAPIWDCDSCLGAVDCTRDGCSTSTCNINGWTTRTATYNRTVNPYGKAFTTPGKTSDGKTFENIVAEKWNSKVLPAIDVLMGRTQSNGRLKSFDEYSASIEKASYNNYVMWGFMWYCAAYRGTGLSKSYSRDYSGELSYLKDWTSARAQWLSAQFNTTDPTEPEIPSEPGEVSYYLTGEGFGGWGSTSYRLTPNGDGTYFIDVTLKKGTHYYFKIFDGGMTYFTADFDDPETAAYVTPSVSANRNAEATPEEDQKVRITLRNGKFYITAQPTETAAPTSPTEPDTSESKTTVYFVNTAGWQEVYFYCWRVAGNNVAVNADWPGEPAALVGYTRDGSPVYKAEFEPDYQSFIFNDNQSSYEQTADIPFTASGTAYTPGTSRLNEKTIRIYEVGSAPYSQLSVSGDVDLNGKIDINDVTLIQLSLVRRAELSDNQKLRADTDKNEKVNIRDATTIQLLLAGLVNKI